MGLDLDLGWGVGERVWEGGGGKEEEEEEEVSESSEGP